MTAKEYAGLRIGDTVDYVFYKGVKYAGEDEKHVIMRWDGNEKVVYKSLFMKHAELSTEGV